MMYRFEIDQLVTAYLMGVPSGPYRISGLRPPIGGYQRIGQEVRPPSRKGASRECSAGHRRGWTEAGKSTEHLADHPIGV